MIALLLAALPLVLQEPGTRVPPFDSSRPITATRLEEEIDRSLHWLRTRFDPQTGSFGSVRDDAWALLAFAESPRAYRPTDGPFVDRPLARLLAAQRPDGSFEGDPGLTALVRELLVRFDTAPEARTRAERFAAGTAAPSASVAAAAEAGEAARRALVTRNPDASFGQGAETLVKTAETIRLLSACRSALRAQEGKPAPKDARALPAFGAAERAEVEQSLGHAAGYLLATRIDGGWGFDGRRDAGITAMAVGALLALPEPRPAPVQAAITQGLDFLVALQKDDGSIHEGQLANYVTSASILALARGGRAPDRARIERASAFLKALQSDEGEGYSEGDRFYGGVGYGGDERPDLSNLQMALEALHTAGVPSSDPAFQKALAFLQRCQNRSESNDLALVLEGKTIAAGNDGGSAYAPGESKAGYLTLPDGKQVPRSYGSMSYALLKGYLFAGLSKDDPRVQAVWQWLRENYTLDVNPGFQASDDPTAAYQGLFYYFYTMAKALDLYGADALVDAAGTSHAWRQELCGRLLAMQRQDGSWVNENAARWFEGNPVLATSYAMLTLGTAQGAP
jgi:squalene-hopene/tetraprenyl-beta-curcumene cyclase